MTFWGVVCWSRRRIVKSSLATYDWTPPAVQMLPLDRVALQRTSGVLARYGIKHTTAEAIAKNDLRKWDLDEIDKTLKKINVPWRGYCYFRQPFFKPAEETFDFRQWWPSVWIASQDSRWVSPPREMMHRSVKEQTALCVNAKGEWTLRTGGYVALSHVWIEGLQRDNDHNGLSGEKFRAIFALLEDRKIKVEWVWTDVLAIPGGNPAKVSSADEMLTIDIINTLPHIYSRAEAVIIIDALVLQLHSESLTDIAIALICGQWTTRVWTFQEIKLAQRALVVTATGAYRYSDIVRHLETLADAQPEIYRSMYLRLAILEKNEERGLSIPDMVMACRIRGSGTDIDYARAFFPVLGLKWEYGMTREEGMQIIYRSQKRHATRIACYYGAPRMKINPAWAPSYFHGLEGIVTEPLAWDYRGIRGDWYTIKVVKVLKKFPHSRRTAFNLQLDCAGDQTMQCALAPNEDPDVIHNLEEAITRGQTHMISQVPSHDVVSGEWARTALLVEKENVNEYDGFEAAVYCAAIVTSRNCHAERRQPVLLRHGTPSRHGGLRNRLIYFWHSQKEESLPATLQRQEGESELHAAVRTGKLSAVSELVQGGSSIEDFDSRGWTPLHTAAARGETEILEFLLASNPNIEIKGEQHNEDTPLAFAARNRQAGTIRVLLSHGANVHARDKYEDTPIMIAAYERDSETVKELIIGGANPNDEAPNGRTPLLLASGGAGDVSHRLPTIRALIEGGAKAKPDGGSGRSPLTKIAIFGSAEEMAYMLEHGFQVDEPESGDLTPLCHAIRSKNVDCVKVLLDAGADCKVQTSGNWTPAHYAAAQPNWQIMQMLLQKGVDMKAQTEPEGWTPLHIAVKEQKTMTLPKMLLEAGADLEAQDKAGKSAIQYLAMNKDLLPIMSQFPEAARKLKNRNITS
ncbi:MAG: hypothetical protein Q9170_006438 [Blastenia crenularia]